MLYLHPLLQIGCLLAAWCAAYLGWGRVRERHLGAQGVFRRRRHILMGKLALGGWLGGLALGTWAAFTYWQGAFPPVLHARLAVIMVPLLAWGIISGLFLQFVPRTRRWLPLLHGLGNLLLLVLGTIQLYTGYLVLQDLVWTR